MPKFHVQTFGCRCNQADSAAIREGLYRCSMVECDTPQDADLIVVNTCTVTHRADQQARQAIRKLHRENPAARVIVTGCYAERDPETIAALPGVKLVLGNAAKERLPEIVERPQKTAGEKIIRTPLDFGPECLMAPMSQTGGKTRPYVKLQDGCDAHCSYCIVPKVRGPGRSVRPEDVLAEIGTLVHKGFQEIVLTGINLGAYGRKFENKTRLGELVRQIVKIPGLGRIRLSSIEPMHFERSLVQLALESPVIARHFHIPMQSGSDRILRLMRRPYRSARFRDLLGYIRNELPGAGLGTDVLVGFPGETDKDFQDTCDLIRESPLTYLHVFRFSAREGTEAYSLPGQVPSQIIQERLGILDEIAVNKSLSFRRQFIGRVLPAITLSEEETQEESAVLTDNYIPVRIRGQSVPPNKLVDICVEDVQPGRTYARLFSPLF